MKKALGTHLLLEMFGCDPNSLRDQKIVERILIESAEKSNAKIVGVFFHQFQPYGVSGAVIIEESHFTVHTWPEHGFAAVDLFFCAEDVDSEKAIEVLRRGFKAKQINVIEVKRGLLLDVENFNSQYSEEVAALKEG